MMMTVGPVSPALAPMNSNQPYQQESRSPKAERSTSFVAAVKAPEAPISVSSSPVSSSSPAMPIFICSDSDVPLSPASAAEVSVPDLLLGPTSDAPLYKHALLIAGTLRKRLAYAHYKVQNGWENESFENVEKWTNEKYAKLSEHQKRKAAGLARKKLHLFSTSDIVMVPRKSEVVGIAAVKVVKESVPCVSEELDPISESEKLDLKRARKSVAGTRKKARVREGNDDTRPLVTKASESPAPAPSQMNLKSSIVQTASNSTKDLSNEVSSVHNDGALPSATHSTGPTLSTRPAYSQKMDYAPQYSHYPSNSQPSSGSNTAGPHLESQSVPRYSNAVGSFDYNQNPKGTYPFQSLYSSTPSMGPYYGANGRLPLPIPSSYGQPPVSSYLPYPYLSQSSQIPYRSVMGLQSTVTQASLYDKPSTHLPPPQSTQTYQTYSSSQYLPSTEGVCGTHSSTRVFPPSGAPMNSSQPYHSYTLHTAASEYGLLPATLMDRNGYFAPQPPKSSWRPM
ncbi:hypothetical protein BDR26DRAFT_919621 [Obelidium mucronatum]|nr:hypothetical protein BDR26DRAFT_919621 [Obelidium mucronatum]